LHPIAFTVVVEETENPVEYVVPVDGQDGAVPVVV